MARAVGARVSRAGRAAALRARRSDSEQELRVRRGDEAFLRQRPRASVPQRRRRSGFSLDSWLPPRRTQPPVGTRRSEEHTSELQSQSNIVCRLLLEKKKK